MSSWKKLGDVLTGAAVGFVTGGVPGAIVGGYSGYQSGKQEQQAADAQQQAMQQAQGGIDAQIQAQREGLAAALAGQQTSYDLMRHHQQQQMPWTQASLGALQTLPILQQALGLPSYAIPDSIQAMPEVNFMQQFNQALDQYGQQPGAGVESFPGQDTPGATPPMAPGLRPTPAAPDRHSIARGLRPTPATPPFGGPTTQGESTSLTPAAPGQFNMEASPLYQWQKKEVTESLRNQLAAQGLGQSTYGQREESRMRESISAHERERQVRDMMSMINIGLGGLPAPTGAEMMPANAGAGVAQSMANVGAIQGQGAMGMAQMGIDAATARAAQPPAWMQSLQVASMFGNTARTPSFGTPPYFPQAANQTMGMMGVPIPIFN